MDRPIAAQAAVDTQLYAAVDLGSNSFHLVVVRVVAGNVQIIGKVKQKVRLAAGLDDEMMLDDASMQRGWECLKTFAERLQDIPVNHIRVVGTATLRLAKNANVFIQKAEAILNHRLEVISGEEEARQIYLGVAYTSANQGNTLVIDIGGASTEVIVGNDMNPISLVSLEMGCVTFMERYFVNGELSEANFRNAIAAAQQKLLPVRDDFVCFDWQQCLGASGTPQAITEILVAQDISDAIRLDYLHNLMQQCIDCGHIDRLSIEGLEEPRRPIFPSGLSILIALFEQLKIDEMQISGGALREGLIYGMLDNIQHTDRRLQTLQELVARFHIEATQAQRVTQLALRLYEQLCAQSNICNFDARAVLEAAATLHEIGLHIEYKQYHQHGAYILNHLPMHGYTQLQRKCIRDLVRSHRQELQASAFDNYHPDVRPLMWALSRILRLACLLSMRRKDHLLPDIQLTVTTDTWSLTFPDGWLKAHPLIDAELANEKWLQHKAGLVLNCQG
ncbi:guanosine-5'-triphosphate,3'-diphosphate pyrophosphatase [Aestuariibacter halophilus]|uniref:Guanosine-5'-triphosphate,3'-diphosphate pyrophosphatase n=1 Tax=Fluctibacter halophilus TaxID=226011 RepID=A0ABS8GGB6_9ALTE|nr:guanosine-5'-triphosphate,3'-diphosphate pyrophosphatase [Aestuariibacter halophilus]MCC2618226.1 guanosine-5'-triphosphate,3'-diphosphate pyrophosphatase [Aestuariibacter halophilus]